MAPEAFRKGPAGWMRPARTHAKSAAAKDVGLARHSAALVVAFADDTPGGLLDAGQLAERSILTASARGPLGDCMVP